jgi:catechol 2,3-dioxygenase-like lactoylglutathione lyase family enzyme
MGPLLVCNVQKLEKREDEMTNNPDLKGPAFIGLKVRDVEVSARFYETVLGLRRDPEVFPRGIAFLTYPVPFGLIQAPPDTNWEALPAPIETPAIWFKAADSQAVYDALVAAEVPILRPLTTGRFGRQFTFLDPDGYAITIYDRDAPAAGWPQVGR